MTTTADALETYLDANRDRRMASYESFLRTANRSL